MIWSNCRGRVSDKSHHQLGDGPGADRWGVGEGPVVRLLYWSLGDRWHSMDGMGLQQSCATQQNHHQPRLAWTAEQVKTPVGLWEALGLLHRQVLKLGACAGNGVLGWPPALAWSQPGKSCHHQFHQRNLEPTLSQNMHTCKCSLTRHSYRCTQRHRYTSPLHTQNRLRLLPAQGYTLQHRSIRDLWVVCTPE